MSEVIANGDRSWREEYEEEITRGYERRKCESDAERARVARVAAEKQQPQAATNNLTAWYAAIDQRIEQHFSSGSLGLGGALKDAIGAVMGRIRQQLRGEFKHAIQELTNAFVAELARQRERLREEFRVGIGRLPIAKTWNPDAVCYRGDVVIRDGAVFQCLRDTPKPPAADHSDWILLARAGRDAPMLNFRGLFDAREKYRRFSVIEFDGSSFVAVREILAFPARKVGNC
jgi:hypothetical protein